MNDLLSPELISQLTDYAVRIVGVLIALFIANIVASMVRDSVRKNLEKRGFDLAVGRFLANLSRWALLTAAVVSCMGVFGIETTSFAAIIGSASLAVGLAFQGTLGNFAAGIMLLVFRPFTVGQFIKVAGMAGTVTEIDLFTTALDTSDNRRIIIPNGQVFGATIENVSHHALRRCDVSVGASYDADVDATRAVLEKVVAECKYRVDDKESAVFLGALGASSVDWTLRVWVKAEDYWAAFQDIMRNTKVEMDAAGIGIPYNTVDVHIVSEPAKS